MKVMDNIYSYTKKDGVTVYRIRRYNSRTKKSEIRTVTPPKGCESGRKLINFLTEESNKFFREVDGGISPATGRMTFSEYYEHNFQEYKHRVAKKTLHDYNGLYQRHIKPWMGGVRVKDIDKNLIVQFFNNLEDKGVGASTFNATYRVMHMVLEYLVSDDILIKNPLDSKLVKMIPVESKTFALTPEELEEMITVIEKEPVYWRSLFMFLICTGCRRGEALGMRWNDIHLFEQYPYIEINHSVEYVPGEPLSLVSPKTPQSHRVVYIPNVLHELLYEMYEHCHTGYVFHGSKGPDTILNPDSVNHEMTRMCERNDVRHISPHVLRRTLATTLVTRERIDPKTLQSILGHADFRTTMKYYVKPQEDLQRSAMKAYAGYFGGNS